MERAQLRMWDRERGFGFATAQSGGKDIFVHASAFRNGMNWFPQVGDVLEVEVRVEDRGPRAIHAQVIGD